MGSLGVTELVILIVILGVVVVPLVLAIWAVVDASNQPAEAWAAAGISKTTWIVLPLAGLVLCFVAGGVAALVYRSSVRPKLVASRPSYHA